MWPLVLQAPELVVAIQASLVGLSGLALGNVVGSNIANVLLVLGLPILFFSLNIGNFESKRDFGLCLHQLLFLWVSLKWHHFILAWNFFDISTDTYSFDHIGFP